MECAKILVTCTECNIEWEEPKPELPTHYPIDQIDKMPYSHKLYNIQIKEMKEQKTGEWFYCRSCESFVSDDLGLFKAQYHPKKDLLPIHAFFLKTQIVSESTFFEWIKINLSTEFKNATTQSIGTSHAQCFMPKKPQNDRQASMFGLLS